MSFTMRTSCPSNNKYYIRQANGGYNGAIQGKPTRNGANVLANCVGYANGRFAEIINAGKIQYQLVCNAENFIEAAKKYGLSISSTPTLGGIMVWQKGSTLGSSDGAGHVAIVERIDNSNQIYTSESSYNGAAFYNATRTNSNGRWGMNSNYTFRGCIINPSVKEDPTTLKYKVGDTVTINGVYTSSNSTNKLVPAVKTGTITKIVENARNPYLLNNGNIGWVNDECIVSTPTPTPTKRKVGDVVNINGVYTSSNSTKKLVPAIKTGTITKIVAGARNPYLLNNGNIGWVNDDCIV